MSDKTNSFVILMIFEFSKVNYAHLTYFLFFRNLYTPNYNCKEMFKSVCEFVVLKVGIFANCVQLVVPLYYTLHEATDTADDHIQQK
jgi:hypothetical protein